MFYVGLDVLVGDKGDDEEMEEMITFKSGVGR